MHKNIFIFLIYLLLITSFINKVNAQESMQQPQEIEIKTGAEEYGLEEYALEEYVLIEEISVEQTDQG